MNKLYIFCIFLLSSSLLTADEEIIKSKLKNVLPADTVIESIEPSPFKGVYKLYYGDLQPIYVSKDGNFFIFGDMYRICLLYTSPSPRDVEESRMPSSA